MTISTTPSLFQEGIRFQDGTLQTTAASGSYPVYGAVFEINFSNPSSNEDTTCRTTITGQSWASFESVILCNPSCFPTLDHSGEDAALEQISVYADNIVPGTGFDLVAYAPRGTWGRYNVCVLGSHEGN